MNNEQVVETQEEREVSDEELLAFYEAEIRDEDLLKEIF